MTELSLMKGNSVWVERKVEGEPFWHDGVFHRGESVITYEELTQNFVEDMDREEVEVNAAGYSTKSVKWLLTDHVLQMYNESPDDASFADKVYLRDPTSGKKAIAWVVFDMESLESDEGFEFLTTGYNYVLVREDKLKRVT